MIDVNCKSSGIVATVKQYIDGSPILVTLAESSKFNPGLLHELLSDKNHN